MGAAWGFSKSPSDCLRAADRDAVINVLLAHLAAPTSFRVITYATPFFLNLARPGA